MSGGTRTPERQTEVLQINSAIPSSNSEIDFAATEPFGVD